MAGTAIGDRSVCCLVSLNRARAVDCSQLGYAPPAGDVFSSLSKELLPLGIAFSLRIELARERVRRKTSVAWRCKVTLPLALSFISLSMRETTGPVRLFDLVSVSLALILQRHSERQSDWQTSNSVLGGERRHVVHELAVGGRQIVDDSGRYDSP